MKRPLAKRLAALLLILALLPALDLRAGAADICLTRQALKVNGQPVSCQAYNIDGSNYFRLRDLAALLADTGSRFQVEYDEERQAVLLTRGVKYTEGMLAPGEDKSSTAQLSRQRVFIDGVEQPELIPWNIGDHNYFKLRDLGDALGFHVNYDEESSTMLVRSRFDPGQARLTETADAGREYLDKIIFLGDSTTYGIGYYYRHGYTDLCPPDQVWTPRDGTMALAYWSSARILYPPTKEELSIAECARRAKPEILIITLGVNGLGGLTERTYREYYSALVAEIREASPNTEIIMNSIYPVADSWEGQSYINNERIGNANRWGETLAEELGCRFLYSFEALAVDGKLPESRQNGDGLHLTGEAFGLVMQYIRTHALPLA